MRDLQVCSTQCPNGVVFGEKHVCPPLPSPSPLPASNPEPSLIREESWESAEKTTQEIVFMIWPTLVADQKRQHITQYVKGLVEHCTATKVMKQLQKHLPRTSISFSMLLCMSSLKCF